MPLLMLAVILAVAQTPPPVPRKATDNQTAQTTDHRRKANNNQNSSAPIASTASPPTPQANSRPNPATPRDTEKTVSIRELPAVTVSTDWWSRTSVILTGIYVVLTAALVIVGGFGVCYARRSLLAIESQLGAMKNQVTEMQAQTGSLQRSVGIAEENLKLIVDKERARISVTTPEKLDLKDGLFNHIKFQIHVFAPTPAVIVSAEVNACVEDATTVDYRWTYDMHLTSIDTRTSVVINKTTLLMVNVSDAFRQEMNQKRKFVHFYGFVKYRDVFQAEMDEPHETMFGYLWVVGSDIKGGFPEIGEGRWSSDWEENPPGGNKET